MSSSASWGLNSEPKFGFDRKWRTSSSVVMLYFLMLAGDDGSASAGRHLMGVSANSMHPWQNTSLTAFSLSTGRTWDRKYDSWLLLLLWCQYLLRKLCPVDDATRFRADCNIVAARIAVLRYAMNTSPASMPDHELHPLYQ